MNHSAFERAQYAIIVSTLLLLAVVALQPILNLLAISLSDPAVVPSMSGSAVLPQSPSIEVWKLLLSHPAVRGGLWNSLLITVVATILNVAVTTAMAWALSRPALPGRRTLFVLVLVTVVFEPGIIPDYIVMMKFGLLDSYAAVMLYKLVNAWYLIILVRFFEAVPQDILDAAALDGAGPLRTLVSVVLPLARPAIVTITLFYLVYHWNDFLRPMMYLADHDKWPLQVVLRQFVVEGDKTAIVGAAAMSSFEGASQINMRAFNAAMILLTIAPVLLVYPLILKYFTKGAMSGGMKG